MFLIVRQNHPCPVCLSPLPQMHESGLAPRARPESCHRQHCCNLRPRGFFLVAGNHRLGGNIRLTVSLSQENVPPTGRLCQCGAAVGSGRLLLVASLDRTGQARSNGRAEGVTGRAILGGGYDAQRSTSGTYLDTFGALCERASLFPLRNDQIEWNIWTHVDLEVPTRRTTSSSPVLMLRPNKSPKSGPG